MNFYIFLIIIYFCRFIRHENLGMLIKSDSHCRVCSKNVLKETCFYQLYSFNVFSAFCQRFFKKIRKLLERAPNVKIVNSIKSQNILGAYPTLLTEFTPDLPAIFNHWVLLILILGTDSGLKKIRKSPFCLRVLNEQNF